MNKTKEIYDELSKTYDQLYVEGQNNPYMEDEREASEYFQKYSIWWNDGASVRIVSLGCGTGQDVQIMGYPDPELFVGYDISEEMLKRARIKYPEYDFKAHNCEVLLNHNCDLLVSIFGAPNYLGANTLLKHYDWMGAKHAFFIFYNENYEDGVIDGYHRYTKEDLVQIFGVVPEELGRNYYVIGW